MKSFCFWDAKSQEDTFIIIANLTITILLFLIAIFNIFRSIKYFTGKITRIYALVLLWAVCNSIHYHSYDKPILILNHYLLRLSAFFRTKGYSNVVKDLLLDRRYSRINNSDSFSFYLLHNVCIKRLRLTNVRHIAISMNLKLSFM